MSNKDMISLDFYKSEYKILLENYYLPEEQRNNTALPLDALKQCEQDHTRYPIVILYNQIPSGFFVLHGWEGVKAYSHNKEAILLRAYSVNHTFQGKGIAKASLQLLPEFIKENFPFANEIILAVNLHNKVAQQVYQKCGFVDKGIRVMGPKGELLVYHLNIK